MKEWEPKIKPPYPWPTPPRLANKKFIKLVAIFARVELQLLKALSILYAGNRKANDKLESYGKEWICKVTKDLVDQTRKAYQDSQLNKIIAKAKAKKPGGKG
jgi:hypothetical protein